MCPVTVGGSLPEVQERLESSGAGRVVISVLVVAVVASIVASSLPGGSLRRSVERRDRALLAVTGLDQRLSVLYVATVLEKLGGETWRDGTAVSYALRLEDFQHLALPTTITGSAVVSAVSPTVRSPSSCRSAF